MYTASVRALMVLTIVLLFSTDVFAQYARRTAIVEAVDKTRDGIVTLKVVKENEYGKKEVVGTGVVIDERGFAVTNAHVVADAVEVHATLSDGTRASCSVYASIPRFDMAILRMSIKKKLKALTFAPGSDLMVGETVIAVGNPYGFANSVSTGIVSALKREITMPNGEKLTNLIQHSASINPGNSGGPLLNVNGEVIGINVALREGAQGIAFALNAEMIKQVLSKHLSATKISHIDHGLSCTEKIEGQESQNRQKVVVKQLTDGSAAAKAGLKSGDVIVKVGNLNLTNRFDLERAFWGYKSGDKITATVLRNGKTTTVAFTLGDSDTRVTSGYGE